jgi:hypothetical protein
MDMGQHAWELLHPPDALGPARSSGVMSRSLSCGRLGGGRFELRTPPSPPTGTEYGRGSRFCVVVHGIRPNVRRNLSVNRRDTV